MFPSWGSGWVYIENVKTGRVMDVQGGTTANGTSVWPYALNHSNAQIFRFSQYDIPDRFGSDARRIRANDTTASDYYLSAKAPSLVFERKETAEPSGRATVDPDMLLPPNEGALDSERSSEQQILRNVVFSIEEESEVDDSLLVNLVGEFFVPGGEPKQIWKVLPVQGEMGAFFIQSAHLKESMVVQPLDFSSGGTLVLSSFTGSDLQKWRIRTTAPPEPTNLRLTNFRWTKELDQTPWYKPWTWHYDRHVQGTLSWSNADHSVVVGQRITVSTGSSHDFVPVDAGTSSHDFKVPSSESAKRQEHCLSLRVLSRWQSQNRTFSDEVCGIPDVEEEPEGPTPVTGVGSLHVFNCHDGRKSVRLWTYDLTEDTGSWEDHGTLGSQWQGSHCGGGTPKVISLRDGHAYRLVATDCGNLPPHQTQGSCHRLTATALQGADNDRFLSFTVS